MSEQLIPGAVVGSMTAQLPPVGRGYLVPSIDDLGRPFWDGLAAGELRVPRCAGCGRRQFPPRPMCAACRAIAIDWETVAPLATIWSFAVAHPPVLPAFEAAAPYNVAVVTIDADPTIRMIGNVVDADGDLLPGASLAIGAPVSLAITEVSDDVRLPRWRLR